LVVTSFLPAGEAVACYFMRRVANFRNYDPLTNPWLVNIWGFA